MVIEWTEVADDDYATSEDTTNPSFLRLQTTVSYLDDQTGDEANSRAQRPQRARKQRHIGKGPSELIKKTGRGCVKGFTVANQRVKVEKQKVPIQFSAKCVGPIGPNERHFVDEVVLFVRKRAPIIGVKSRWDFEDIENPREKIDVVARQRYKGWRSTFSATYKAYDTYAERIKYKPKDLDIVEWHYLMLYFGTENFKKRSSKNSENRKKRRTNHVMGSKPFSQRSHELRDPENGEEPSDLKLWRLTHTKGEEWSDPASKEVYENACFKIDEAFTLWDGYDFPTEEEDRVFQRCYNDTIKSKSYRVHGQGYLAKYPSGTQLLSERLEEQANATTAAKQEVEKLKAQLEEQAAEPERDKEETRRQMQLDKDAMREELKREILSLVAQEREGRMETTAPTATKNIEIAQDETRPTVNETIHNRTTPAATKSIEITEAETQPTMSEAIDQANNI